MGKFPFIRRILGLVLLLFTFRAHEALAIPKAPLVPPDTRFEYQCQIPMRLVDFSNHMEGQTPQRSIHWNLRSVDPLTNMRTRLIQISAGTVSPGASFILPRGQGHYELPLRPLTMERNWLEALRGTDAVDALHPAQQMVMWINELYHLFVIDPQDSKVISADDPFLPALANGAYIFTNEKMAFAIGKDHGFLTICPRISEQGKVEMTSRQIMAEVRRFIQDPRIVRFFSCESLLTRYKI